MKIYGLKTYRKYTEVQIVRTTESVEEFWTKLSAMAALAGGKALWSGASDTIAMIMIREKENV